MRFASFSFSVVLVGVTTVAYSQVMDPVNLTPASATFSVSGPTQSPVALVLTSEPDTWQFDTSAFGSAVNMQIVVSDWFAGGPDDYDIYVDNVLIGNSWTGNAAVGTVFDIQPATDFTLIRIEYTNHFSGVTPSSSGSYYNMTVTASPVPEPASMAILTASAVALARLRARKN